MAKLSPIIYLKETLPESSWPWVIPALRQDSLIWESLQDQDFLKRALQDIGEHPKKWTPMNLALLSLGVDLAIKDLGHLPLKKLSPYLHQQAVQAYQNHTSDGPPPIDLPQAGLLALYFSEHPAEGRLTSPPTSLACLFSLLPRPVEFLSQLTPEMLVHAILSNPLEPGEQVEIYTKILGGCDSTNRAGILKALACQHPKLATNLTSIILENDPASLEFKVQLPKNDPLNNLSSLLSDADILSIADRQGEQLDTTSEAWTRAGELHTSLGTRMTTLEITQGDLEKARKHWQAIQAEVSPDQVVQILLALCAGDHLGGAVDWFDGEAGLESLDEHKPDHNLGRAFLFLHQGDQDATKQAAMRALTGYARGEFPNPDHLRLLARLFLSLNLAGEALQALNLALEIQPNHFESINLLMESHRSLNQKDQAIQAAHLAVAIQPKDLDSRRTLAQALESAGHWSHAMHERGKILSMQEPPELQDCYRFASAALKAGQPQRTAGIIQNLLQTNPSDPEAQRLLGEAYLAMGDPQKAKNHFALATELVPDSASAWLGLAEVYQRTNQKTEQRETLQAASKASPDQPAIYLSLGKLFLEDGAPTQALNAFRTADSLVKESKTPVDKDTSSGVAQALGETLLQLGHLAEARGILEPAYEADKEHMGIAHAYARTLLTSNLPERAIPILDNTRKKNPKDLDIHLDYAKACLATSTNLEDSRDTLVEILEKKPDHAEAKAYLAKAYQATHNLEASLEAYQEALSTPLREDPAWNAKLSLGLGKVSLEAGKPETAIATLRGALLANGEDAEVLKTLSSAYQAVELKEKAFWAANSVLEIAPEDDDHLDWFIQQALALDATSKALGVLEKHLEKNPQRAALLTKIGWLHVYNEDHDKAREYFARVKTIEEITPPDLYQASQGLLAVGDPKMAIEYLEKAIFMDKSTGGSKLLPKMYVSKILAHQLDQDPEQALETTESAITESPSDHKLIQKKAEILLDLKQGEAAVSCLEEGIKAFPQVTALRLQAAVTHRAIGDLQAASTHAKSALEVFTQPLDMSTAAVIADLAHAMMLVDVAKDAIEGADGPSGGSTPGNIHFYCIQGELAIEAGEEVAAANALTAALQIDPEHPRVLALQARLTLQQGDAESANQFLQKALEALGDTSGTDESGEISHEPSQLSPVDQTPSVYIALADASLGFHLWNVTKTLLQKAVELAPNEPRNHFKLARALVLKAEHQRLCQLLDIIEHAPGTAATAEFAYKQFEDTILKAAHQVTELTLPGDDSAAAYLKAKSTIASWLSRGQAIFQPSSEHAQALSRLPECPDHLAAHIAALRHCGDLNEARATAQKIYDEHGSQIDDPRLLGQIALALANEAPETALSAAGTAIEVSTWRNLPERPVYHAIYALIAERSGNQALQLSALQDALDLWPEEPKWLSTAASLLLGQEDPDGISKAIDYLEQAAHLEPNQVDHYLRLGEAHQKLGNQKGAIVVLDQATRILPQHAEPWLALAQAHRGDGDIPQTIRCAKKVIELDPTHPKALILMAEVSLSVENPQKAARHIDTVLTHHPEDIHALLLRSKIYTALNQPGKALESLETILPRVPKSIPLQLQRVQLLEKTRGPEPALEALHKLSEEDPQDPRILAAYAETLSKANELEGAIKKAQEALGQGIQDLEPEAYIQTLQLLGRLLRKTGQLDQAIHYLSVAIDQSPEVPGPYIELGRCYHDQRQHERALETLQSAIKIAPRDAQPYYHAGLIFKDMKDFLNAEVMFKYAAKLAPTDLHIYRQLGAVTAINLVHNRQSQIDSDSQATLAVPVESIET